MTFITSQTTQLVQKDSKNWIAQNALSAKLKTKLALILTKYVMENKTVMITQMNAIAKIIAKVYFHQNQK